MRSVFGVNNASVFFWLLPGHVYANLVQLDNFFPSLEYSSLLKLDSDAVFGLMFWFIKLVISCYAMLIKLVIQ